DLKDLTTDLSELITGLLDLGKRIDMEVRVHLHSQRRPKKLAILVSKEPHCLEQLIEDVKHRRLHGEVACVLANHPDLEPIATAAGLKFEWRSADDPAAHFAWLLRKLREYEVDL